MSRRLMVPGIVVLGLTTILAGCSSSKGPNTADDMDMVKKPAESAEVVTPPPKPPTTEDVKESPWWEDKSAVELNQEAVRRGFHAAVYFDLDRAELSDEAQERLASNARFFKNNPELRATIEGHCDERGTNEYNLALGDRRANTARDYVTSLGVSGSRLRTISYGEERPICTVATEGCWARNRRAYFVVSKAN